MEASGPPASALPYFLTSVGRLESAAFRLAAGSAILYLSGLLMLGGTNFVLLELLVLLVPVAVVFHLAAWFSLREEAARDLTGVMGLLFGLSVLGLLLGMMTIPLQFPEGRANGWLFTIGLIPFIPAVWGPVVLTHAAMFLWKNDRLAPRPIGILGDLGAFLLIGTAALGMLGQAATSLGLRAALVAEVGEGTAAWWLGWIFMPMPAGLTAIGYAMEYVAWIAFASGWRVTRGREPSPVGTPAAGP